MMSNSKCRKIFIKLYNYNMSSIDSLLKNYLDYLEIEKNRSPKTRENYGHYLRVFIDYSKIKESEDITMEVVKQFRIWLARNKKLHPVRGRSSQDDRSHSPSARTASNGINPVRNRARAQARSEGPSGRAISNGIKKITQTYYVIAIRNFLKYLAKQDYNVLSSDKIELPKIARRQIDIIEYADLERFLAAPAQNTLRGLRDRAILETFFSTGLRISELCDLDRYLNLNRGEISVRGKGEKIRVVFLSDRARATIKNYLEKRNDPLEHLFISITKSGKVIGRITPRAIQRLVEFYRRKAGIAEKITPHQIRHQFATDLLINGADLRSVQELLGHSNISTTQIYTHITNKELKDIHKSFHARRRK